MFEVDHPATQEWKRARLDALGIADLSLDAIHATLAEIPPCMLAVSHATPEDMWPDDVRTMSNTFRSIAAQAGEPPMTWFAPDQFADLLAANPLGVARMSISMIFPSRTVTAPTENGCPS